MGIIREAGVWLSALAARSWRDLLLDNDHDHTK